MADQVTFLGCMDKNEKGKDALGDAKSCATGVDFSKVTTCYNGDQGQTLLNAASKVWNKYYPQRSYVPAVRVNGEEEQGGPSGLKGGYAVIKAAMCKAGSKAAVCSGAFNGRLI